MPKKLFILLVVVLAGCLTVWLWAEVELRRQAEGVKKLQAASEQARARWKSASGQNDGGQIAPMKWTREDLAWADESLTVMRRRGRLLDVQAVAVISGMGAVLVWVLGAVIYGAIRNRQWESANRPALPGAGTVVQQLLATTGRYEARETGGGGSIEVDARSAQIAFRNFSFVTSFWRNPAQPLVALDFTELLTATLRQHRGVCLLHLRTTRGRVVVTENIHPFEELACLLCDIVELNRASPEQYRAMLQRELKVKTPWYGWLMLTGALAAVVAFGWWVWSLGG